ncbi:MAG: alpha/beta hydrolase fold domain-containing protein [Bacteroidaceae bacterium]|nr:alpha/beta hydrolase fold domain-containing protein [Bacteroidaceae bacterium]
MKNFKQILFALSLLLAATVHPAMAGELEGDSVWVKGEALLTKAAQISANNTQSGFPASNLLRPESDGVGTNQYIWHTSWGNPAVPPKGTDTYLQVHFDKPQTDIIFTMIGSAWVATGDTPTEIIIQGTDNPDGEWTELEHLKEMQNEFTAFSPDRYTSPHIALGASYSYLRFVVKKTMNAAYSSRYDTNGNPFVSLGRFQVYNAVKEAPTPIDPKDNINLLFIGNSITYGAGLGNPAAEAPPAVCRSLIESATGVTTNLYNGGHSGITTLGFMPGREDFTRVVNAAKTFKKNNGGLIYFSIMLGTNDSACMGTEGAPVSTTTYKANIKAIIDALIEAVPDCRILLNYPIWYSPNTHNGATYLQEGLDRLYSYYPVIDDIAEEYDRVTAGNREVWNYFEDNKVLFIAESGNSGTFYLHPNALGAQRLAEVWSRSLLDIIATDSIEIKKPLADWKFFTPSNDKKYTISTPRGYYGAKDGVVTNTAKSGIGASRGEFAFITYKGELYIYSINGKKFLHRDPMTDGNGWSDILLSDSEIEPFKVQYTGGNATYPYCLTSLGYIANTASHTQKGVVLNSWNHCDAGNQTAIKETGDFDPTEALQMLDEFFANRLTVTYRIVDSEGNLLEELTGIGMAGDTISELPDDIKRRAYTQYTIDTPVTPEKGKENIVTITAQWELPFELSTEQGFKWYNLALRGGEDYVTASNGYKCNINTTKEQAAQDTYQWAFKGNPYSGIVIYNRSDSTKTLAKVGEKAILSNTVYAWNIIEANNGFLLANNEDGKYINEYGGAGGDLGFWTSPTDIGSIFSVSAPASMPIKSVKLSSGAYLKIFTSSKEKANGRAVLVIPGGAYAFVATGYEGSDWAPFLNDLGYTAAVLTYTTPPTSHSAPLKQARDAMKHLRENGEEYNVTTGQIGVIGSSAGGHLASTVATHTKGDERPIFQILFYPVITMDATFTHTGSRENLIGKNPPPAIVKLYSNEKQVSEATPAAYICWAADDGVVPPRNSTVYAAALKEKGVPVRTKSLPSGGHGFGFSSSYAYHDQIAEDIIDWLESIEELIVTGIDTPEYETPEDNTYYNLMGEPVKRPQRGIYIKNNRKVFVK